MIKSIPTYLNITNFCDIRNLKEILFEKDFYVKLLKLITKGSHILDFNFLIFEFFLDFLTSHQLIASFLEVLGL